MGTIQLQLREQLEKLEKHDDRRITLADLAQTTGIAEDELQSMIENRVDQIQLTTLATLCDHLCCTPGDLLRYSAADDDGDDVVDVRDVVDRWQQDYGADEHPPR